MILMTKERLGELRAGYAKIHKGIFCPECGPAVVFDEDGLCVHCGSTCMGQAADILARDLPELLAYVEVLERKVAWEQAMCRGKDETQRKLRKVAGPLFGHDWREAEPSPSGKCGWRCSLCDKYSNAPVLSCLDPCDKRIELLEAEQGRKELGEEE